MSSVLKEVESVQHFNQLIEGSSNRRSVRFQSTRLKRMVGYNDVPALIKDGDCIKYFYCVPMLPVNNVKKERLKKVMEKQVIHDQLVRSLVEPNVSSSNSQPSDSISTITVPTLKVCLDSDLTVVTAGGSESDVSNKSNISSVSTVRSKKKQNKDDTTRSASSSNQLKTNTFTATCAGSVKIGELKFNHFTDTDESNGKITHVIIKTAAREGRPRSCYNFETSLPLLPESSEIDIFFIRSNVIETERMDQSSPIVLDQTLERQVIFSSDSPKN